MDCRVQTDGPEATEALGAKLAARLAAGDVVLVEGELGAGKTTFVRGAARALGVTAVVTSPTFTIGQRYPARVPVSHLDLYRISDLADEDPDLLGDYLDAGAIAFVEWPPLRPEVALGTPIAARVKLEHAGGDRRWVEVQMP